MTRPLPRAAVPADVLARATALARGVTLGPDSPLLAATPPRAPRRDDEHREQAALFAWATRNEGRIPALRWLFAVPNFNGLGRRTMAQSARLSAEGRKRGVPDVLLPWRSRCLDQPRVGLVIEMKSATGHVRPEQRAWLAHYGTQGWCVAVCRSAAEARAALCAYLGVPDPEAL